MPILQGPNGVSVQADGTFDALRTSERPIEYGAGGFYRVHRRFVPIGTTTAGILFNFRNPTASAFNLVLLQLRLSYVQVAAPTAPIEDIFNAHFTRSYTVADTTNSTDWSPAANMNDARTDMANNVAQIRESTAAGGITAGTGTDDTIPFAAGSIWVPAAIPAASGEPKIVFDYRPVFPTDHPLLFEADEGFRIRNTNSFGATSGIVLHLDIAWLATTEANWTS